MVPLNAFNRIFQMNTVLFTSRFVCHLRWQSRDVTLYFFLFYSFHWRCNSWMCLLNNQFFFILIIVHVGWISILNTERTIVCFACECGVYLFSERIRLIEWRLRGTEAVQCRDLWLPQLTWTPSIKRLEA